MGRVIKKLWNGLTSVLVLLMLILALLLAGPKLIGLQAYAVLSGSMEPTYPVGSLLYVREVDTAQLEAGDVITYVLNENTLATHRIAEVVIGEDGTVCFRTKGDANETADAVLVEPGQVLGTPVLSIPYLGHLAQEVQTKAGTYRVIGLAAVLALMIVLPELFTKKIKSEK